LTKNKSIEQILFFICCLVILSSKSVLAQAPKKIIVEHSDFADVNQWNAGFLLTGNVRVNHDGVVLTCKSLLFSEENYIKALEMYNWFRTPYS
jgi:hypothetical protein